MDLVLFFQRFEDIFAEFEHGCVLGFDGFVEDFVEIFFSEMLDIPLIGRKVDGKCKELNPSYIRMGEEDKLEHVVHTVGICEGIPDSGVSGQEVQNVKGSHPIGRILRQEVNKFGYETTFLDHLPAHLVKGHVVVH